MTVPSNSDGRDPPPMDDDDGGGDDSFEFFTLRRSPPAMCAADDVFLAGKLLPFVAPPPPVTPPPPPPPPPPPSKRDETHIDGCSQENAPEAFEVARPSRRFWAGRGGVAKANYRRLRPASDCDAAAKAAETTRQRPRWYLLVLGSMRVPATMDLSEMRSRQQRRQRCPAEAPESSAVDANRGTWKLLRSLSCKGLESAGVAVTFGRDLQGE